MVALSDRKFDSVVHQVSRADDISDHIKHVYADLIEENIPDRFAALLNRLQEMEGEKGPEDAS